MSSWTGAQYEADLPQAPTDAQSGPGEMELLRRAQKGDRAAFGQIVLLFQDRLYNAILRLVGDRDEARDLTQETFMRALSSLGSFRGEAKPYTWLFRIGVNLSISQLRKEQRRRTFSLDQPLPGGGNGQGGEDQASALVGRLADPRSDNPADAPETRERHQQVLAALGRLDPDYRAVLVMRDIEAMDYQQMADVLGLPLGTLKSRLFRARMALKDQMKEVL